MARVLKRKQYKQWERIQHLIRNSCTHIGNQRPDPGDNRLVHVNLQITQVHPNCLFLRFATPSAAACGFASLMKEKRHIVLHCSQNGKRVKLKCKTKPSNENETVICSHCIRTGPLLVALVNLSLALPDPPIA